MTEQEEILELFKDKCRAYGISIIAIASGLAMCSVNESIAIVTLPRHKNSNRWDQLFHQVSSRSQRGRFCFFGPAYNDLSKMVKPNDCMTWEQWDAKYYIDSKGQLVLRNTVQAIP